MVFSNPLSFSFAIPDISGKHKDKTIITNSHYTILNICLISDILQMLVVAILFIANLTVFAGNPGDNLIYNAEEVNGVVVSETIFKMEGTMLTNYMKHNYKYDANNQRTEDEAQKWNSNKNRWENNLCIRYTYGNKSMTTEYYKWNSKKKEYILVPEMTVTMDK